MQRTAPPPYAAYGPCFGFYAAYQFDLPLGPAQVAVACLVLLVVSAVQTLRPRAS